MSGICCDCYEPFAGHGIRCWNCANRLPTPAVVRVSYRLRKLQPCGLVITVVRTPTVEALQQWIARRRRRLAIGRCWVELTMAPASRGARG